MKNRPLSRPDALLIFALVLAFAITLGACWYSQKMIEPLMPEPALPAPAFLSARWGQSPQQVAAANGRALIPLEDADSFHRVSSQALTSGLYKVFQVSDVPFLSRKAKVTYAFWQGRLCAFHVFVQDAKEQEVEDDLSFYLERTYGPNYIEVDDGSPLRRIWTQKDKIINLWLYTDALRLRTRHHAGFGVRFRPISDQIPSN